MNITPRFIVDVDVLKQLEKNKKKDFPDLRLDLDKHIVMESLTIRDGKFIDLEEKPMSTYWKPPTRNDEIMHELDRKMHLIIENLDSLTKDLEGLKRRVEAIDRQYDEMKNNNTGSDNTMSSRMVSCSRNCYLSNMIVFHLVYSSI